MYEDDRQLRDLMLERQALEFLLAQACETLLFYADRGNYNAADDGMEEAASAPRSGASACGRRYGRERSRYVAPPSETRSPARISTRPATRIPLK